MAAKTYPMLREEGAYICNIYSKWIEEAWTFKQSEDLLWEFYTVMRSLENALQEPSEG
jgi:hypothetical protein